MKLAQFSFRFAKFAVHWIDVAVLFQSIVNQEFVFTVFIKLDNDVHFDVDKTVRTIAENLSFRIYNAMPYRVVQGEEYLPYN